MIRIYLIFYQNIFRSHLKLCLFLLKSNNAEFNQLYFLIILYYNSILILVNSIQIHEILQLFKWFPSYIKLNSHH